MSADNELKSYIDRVLRLKEEQDTLGQDIRDVYAEAKAQGFDKTIMGKLVAHLRKVLKEGDTAVSEQEDIFDTYLQAYRRASGMPVATHTHEEEFDPTTGEILDRDARRRQRMTESMDDHKALIDEMADSGLISEDARAENKALADAVATKFGNGPAMALQSPRKAAEAVSERTASTDATVASELVEAEKAEAVAGVLGQPEMIPALTAQHGGVNVGGPERVGVTAGETATYSPETATRLGQDVQSPSQRAMAGENLDVTDRRDDHLNHQSEGDAIAAVNARDGLADANGVEPSSSEFNPMEIARPQPKTARDFRPHCLEPEACAASGLSHCYACRKVMASEEEFA